MNYTGRGPMLHCYTDVLAKPASLSENQIDEMVEQMNATLGWDIRQGLAES